MKQLTVKRRKIVGEAAILVKTHRGLGPNGFVMFHDNYMTFGVKERAFESVVTRMDTPKSGIRSETGTE